MDEARKSRRGRPKVLLLHPVDGEKGIAPGHLARADVPIPDADLAGLNRLYQRYERIGETEYAFEATGYAAKLVFSPSGFVADYPGLWRMVM